MENKLYTRIEIEIQSFITKYGSDELVKWLQQYNKKVGKSDFNTYNRIQKFTCEVYNIPIADINSSVKEDMEYTNAKRIINYLAIQRTKLKVKHLVMIQSCSERTIYYHIKDMEFRLKHPHGFRDFIANYESVLKKLENYDQANN